MKACLKSWVYDFRLCRWLDYASYLKKTLEDFLGYEVSGKRVFDVLKEAETQGAFIAWNYISKHIDLNYVFP